MFLQWIPLSPPFSIEPNKIAPLEGFGLIVLLVFSYFVLKEKINKIEIVGACLIIIGIILINIAFTETSTPELEDINFTSFWISLIIIFFTEITAILVLLLIIKNQRWSGILIALFAGTCMAWQTISKTLSGVDGIRLIFTFVVFFFAIATLALTQWAFTKIQANLVVPLFTSTSILLTAVLGYFILDKTLVVVQIVGIGIIIVGVVLISAFEKPTNLKDGIEISS
jgi:multidrug transporter EmrE-like cation transporter